MKVFFDNCTAPVLAATLNGFISNWGHEAYHIRDVPGLSKGRGTPDVEWIDLLHRAPERWMFISADFRILKNPAERTALRRAGLHGFIMARGFAKMPMQQRAAALILKWPEMLKVTEILAAPTIHEIPVKAGKKLSSLPL